MESVEMVAEQLKNPSNLLGSELTIWACPQVCVWVFAAPEWVPSHRPGEKEHFLGRLRGMAMHWNVKFGQGLGRSKT